MPKPYQVQNVVEGFVFPRCDTYQEAEMMDRCFVRGIGLFTDRPPHYYTEVGRNDAVLHRVSKTGYALVWPRYHRERRERVFQVGIKHKYKQALIQAQVDAGFPYDEGAGGPYIVNLEERRCDCPFFQKNGRYCTHLFAVAYALTKDYCVKENGLIVFAPSEKPVGWITHEEMK